MLLGLLCAFSLVSRAAWLAAPPKPIFDETYYVNAARVIDGIRPPTGVEYATAAPGTDPNGEHPPLVKAMIAFSIRLLGDRPLGWRAPSLLFGTIAILAMYGLALAAGATRWTALAASAVLGLENLFFVHSVIATLDVVAVTFMLAGAAAYLRKRPFLAGVLVGVGACGKIIAFSAIAVLMVLELLRVALPPRHADGLTSRGARRWQALSVCVLGALVAYLGTLFLLDLRYTRFANPVAHTRHMLSYAENLPEQPTPRPGLVLAPTSTPLEWLANREPIVYFRKLTEPGHALRARVFVQGRMSPFVIFMALPAFGVAVASAWRRRDDLSFLVVAWCAGTYLTLAAISLHHNLNYLYYMMSVVPGICLGVVRLLAARWIPRAVAAAYAVGLAYGFVALYPIRIWGGR